MDENKNTYKLEELTAIGREHSRFFTTKKVWDEYAYEEGLPSANIYIRTFDTWNKAKLAIIGTSKSKSLDVSISEGVNEEDVPPSMEQKVNHLDIEQESNLFIKEELSVMIQSAVEGELKNLTKDTKNTLREVKGMLQEKLSSQELFFEVLEELLMNQHDLIKSLTKEVREVKQSKSMFEKMLEVQTAMMEEMEKEMKKQTAMIEEFKSESQQSFWSKLSKK